MILYFEVDPFVAQNQYWYKNPKIVNSAYTYTQSFYQVFLVFVSLSEKAIQCKRIISVIDMQMKGAHTRKPLDTEGMTRQPLLC